MQQLRISAQKRHCLQAKRLPAGEYEHDVSDEDEALGMEGIENEEVRTISTRIQLSVSLFKYNVMYMTLC